MNRQELVDKILCEPKELSESQKDAVRSDARYIRVIAGAGAGKTETLTRRIVYLLLCEGVDPCEIVAFTFTEKAAQSMKSRLYQRMDQLGRRDVLKRLGEMYIGTIHSYCLRLLEDYYGMGDYDVFDENQEMAFLLRVGWVLGLGTGGRYSQNCENFLSSLSVFYSELLDRDELEERAPEFYDMLATYEEQLDAHRRLTFDRLVYEAVKKLEEDPGRLSGIKHLIVDEFQDINKAQFRLIELIGKFASVFVVGDPRQSIYQWRGSNESFFLEFESMFPEAATVNIGENWRSAKEIVRVSNRFADSFEKVKYGHLESMRPIDGELTKVRFDSPSEEADWVASQIQRLVEEKGCKYSDFSVLLRSVNTSAEPFLDAFQRRGIPFLVGGNVGLFRRDEAQAVGRLLSWAWKDGFWVENPNDWRTRINGDELLTTGLDLWSRAFRRRLPPDIRSQLEEWKEKILDGEYPDFKSLYHHLLVLLGYHELDPENPLDAAVMANLGRFSSILGDFEVAHRLGGRRRSWESELKDLCWFMNTYANKSYEEGVVEDLRKANAVQISTVHQAKGLEWPVVFIPALVNQRFPSKNAGKEREWLIPRDMFDAKRYEGGVEDEKRLFYVAITRAMDVAVLSHFTHHDSGRRVSQSEFLDIVDRISVNTKTGSRYNLDYTPPRERPPEEEIQTFSATEILRYLRCPHHYRLLMLWGYITGHSPLIGYGNSLHFCLRHAAELIKNEGLDPITAVATAVDEKFFLPFASETGQEKLKRTARERLIDFASEHEEDMNTIEEVEARLEFPVQNATIVGKVDVILRDGEELEIRDYKTSEEVIKPEDSELQVRLYALGLRNMGRDVTRGSVAYLEKTARVDTVTLEEERLMEARGTAEKVINNIKEGCFEANPGQFCKDCDYNRICRWAR